MVWLSYWMAVSHIDHVFHVCVVLYLYCDIFYSLWISGIEINTILFYDFLPFHFMLDHRLQILVSVSDVMSGLKLLAVYLELNKYYFVLWFLFFHCRLEYKMLILVSVSDVMSEFELLAMWGAWDLCLVFWLWVSSCCFKISKPLVSQYVEGVIVHATAGLQVEIRVVAENI